MNLKRLFYGLSIIALAAALALACGGDDDDVSSTAPSDESSASSSSDSESSGDSTSSNSDSTEDSDSSLSDGGEYVVLMVANVDELTANSALEALESNGFTGFQMEGSASEGFDVFKPGFTLDEANALAEEIAAVTQFQPRAWEAGNLP